METRGNELKRASVRHEAEELGNWFLSSSEVVILELGPQHSARTTLRLRASRQGLVRVRTPAHSTITTSGPAALKRSCQRLSTARP